MTAGDNPRVEIGRKRVRAQFAGEMVADTTRVRLVWERPHFPTYYFPEADVRTDLLVDDDGSSPASPGTTPLGPGGTGRSAPSGTGRSAPSGTGRARVLTVRVGDREAPGAARWLAVSPIPDLEGTIRLSWRAMDAWFEEDEEVHVHPRDPYTRVDVLQSSRHVRIEVDGVTVADSDQPRILFETGLPPRYYLPKPDVRMDLLTPTETTTHCPYKGQARYYAVHTADGVREDLAWWYQHPAAESAKIAGYVCFYDERVEVYVDGVLQERPRTPFS